MDLWILSNLHKKHEEETIRHPSDDASAWRYWRWPNVVVSFILERERDLKVLNSLNGAWYFNKIYIPYSSIKCQNIYSYCRKLAFSSPRDRNTVLFFVCYKPNMAKANICSTSEMKKWMEQSLQNQAEKSNCIFYFYLKNIIQYDLSWNVLMKCKSNTLSTQVFRNHK